MNTKINNPFFIHHDLDVKGKLEEVQVELKEYQLKKDRTDHEAI